MNKLTVIISQFQYRPLIQLILVCGVSIVFNSRSFFIGAITALVIRLYGFLPKDQRAFKITLLTLLIVVTSALTFFIKTDSTQGRLLIYKISWQMFCEQWLTGIGINRFANEYLMYQAEYFSQGKYTMKEVLLADNTYFAFNDYWQWTVETGLLGVLLMAGLLFITIHLIKFAIRSHSELVKTYSAVNALIVILTAALFTHVFEKWWCQVLVIVGLSILIGLRIGGATGNKFRLVFLLITCPFLIYPGVKKVFQNYTFKESIEASELSLYGYHQEGLKLFGKLYGLLKNDYRFLGAYAQALERSGKYQEALHVYLTLSKIRISNYTYYRIAECYNNIKDPRAEYYYKQAINTVPNRLAMREALFSYYFSQGKVTEAIDTGNELLQIPVKIKSRRATDIRERTRTQLNKLSDGSLRDTL